jgi:lipoprotein-anchoring transpeptidase ErfK/SrfK
MHLPGSLAAASAALLFAATMPQLAQARELVGFSGAYSSGTVVVKTGERALYYVVGNGKAVRYPVGVGRAGKQWTGTAMISGKQLNPAWSPPEEVKRDKPSLPNVIPGGSPTNPMGAAAMTLSGGGEYAIHGTKTHARSAASSPTAVFACTTRTCSTCTTGSAGARPWS